MAYLRLINRYLKHLLTAQHTGGHGVHSPFVFNFTQFVLREKHPFGIFQKVEKLRKELKESKKSISITDFGTGENRERPVAEICRKALKSKKYGQLLFRIVNQYKARHIIELGTSLGISGAYLAASSTEIKMFTFEGCPELSKIAQSNFDKLGIKNAEIVLGNIDQTLPEIIHKIPQVDFAFMDANHTSEAVIRYFEILLPKTNKNTIVVVDDIHWSDDMEFAWEKIKQYPQVRSTIDLFELGIVFFNTDLHKKNYKMRF